MVVALNDMGEKKNANFCIINDLTILKLNLFVDRIFAIEYGERRGYLFEFVVADGVDTIAFRIGSGLHYRSGTAVDTDGRCHSGTAAVGRRSVSAIASRLRQRSRNEADESKFLAAILLFSSDF